MTWTCCASGAASYGKPPEAFQDRAERTRFTREAQAPMRTVLGGDLDGLAAEMEDLGLT